MTIQQRIELLRSGNEVSYRESGNSMHGIIEHRQLITCMPIKDYKNISSGDAVFCKVKGRYYTHLVKNIRSNKKEDGTISYEFLIGNNRGGTNGWASQNNVYGKVIRVEP
jgi:hypothetical protein